MSYLIANTPLIDCVVRAEFCFDQQEGHGQVYPGYVCGFIGRRGHAPAFQVQLLSGAMWARVPIHMLAWKECEPEPLEQVCWWDCFSNDFSIYASEIHAGIACELRGRDGQVRTGSYLFTVEWSGGWAELADQHKQHHIIKLDSGNFAAYPNNKTVFKDPSWFEALAVQPRWRVNSRSWSAERTTETAP